MDQTPTEKPVGCCWESVATPFDVVEDFSGLLPTHIVTKEQLDEWEYNNILKAQSWALDRKRDVISEPFIRELHRRMFDQTWEWAGLYKPADPNIGLKAIHVRPMTRDLVENVKVQVEQAVYPHVEIAIRLHHRLAQIHPFLDGNGRHARLMADLFLNRYGLEPLPWGHVNLRDDEVERRAYIDALKEADGENFAPLIRFCQS